MRFLTENILGSYNDQVAITASSGNAYNAFSDTIKFNYQSEGQNVNGNTVELIQFFSSEQSLDTLAVLNHNFVDFSIWISSGFGYIDVTSQAVLKNSADGLSKVYKFSASISFTQIKFTIDDTIIADEEKKVGAILGFTEIGSIERFKSVRTSGQIQKKVIKLESGGVAVLNKGSTHWDFSISTDLVSIQNEIDTVAIIQNRNKDFFFWINDGYDGNQIVNQEPYRFQDFKRCSYTGKNNPNFYKGYFNKTASNSLKFSQTAEINYFDPTL